MKTKELTDYIVPNELHGQRVDIALAKIFPEYSRSQLTQWLKLNYIQINNHVLKPKDKVAAGDRVFFVTDVNELVEKRESCLPENIPLSIVFEDDHVLVVNKAAGLVVHPGAGNHTHTLVNGLLHHAPKLAQLPRAGIIHRLDKETTGLLIVGKTLTSYTNLIRQMKNREIQRRYTTLVSGNIISSGEISTFINRHPHNRLKMTVSKQGREAVTLYKIKKHYDFLTLLDVQLLTGRTHQIRVHMAHIQHPVVGDPLYGNKIRIPININPEVRQALLAFKRQALHASNLQFMHPETNQLLRLTATLPDDFKTLLTVLDDYFV